MNKILVLKICIISNLLLLFIFLFGFFIFNNQESKYFNFGWSDNFVFVSITIDTPVKYFGLCFFIMSTNIFEVFLNDLANPLIAFSTYNPYKNTIKDFSRFELELYSNLIYFVQVSKTFLKIAVTVSQFDIALWSLLSSQIAGSYVINYLLNEKTFQKETYIEIPISNFENVEGIDDTLYSLSPHYRGPNTPNYLSIPPAQQI